MVDKPEWVCFVDLDGVLVDFVHGICEAHGRENPYEYPENRGKYTIEKIWGMDADAFWEPLNNLEFWSSLKPTEHCYELIELVETHFGKEQVGLLTSPSRHSASVAGKAMWIQEHLPDYRRQFFIGAKKELTAHSRAVLIDDSDWKVKRFNKNGGNGCLFPAYGNSAHEWAKYPIDYVTGYLAGVGLARGTHNV